MNTNTRLARAMLGAAAAGALSGCGSASDGSTVGDLGRGDFKYTCISEDGDDSTCPQGASKTVSFNFPTAIAVGGAFKLTFEPNGGSSTALGNPVLKPASTTFLNDDSPSVFVARQPGRVAVVARSSTNGNAADFTYVRIAQPTSLVVRKADSGAVPTKLTVQRGQTFTLRAESYADHEVRLAGTVSYDWSTDGSVLTMQTRSPSARVTFLANAPGTTTVHAKQGTLTADLPIEVTP